MTTTQLLTSALAGFGLGLGLIVAIGAQNAFVLRQGVRRENVLVVVLVCIASDAVLIAAGVAGAGALFTAVPWLVPAARWGGALFLAGYAVLAARRALRRPTPDAEGLVTGSPRAAEEGAGGRDATGWEPVSTAAVGRSEGVGTSTLAVDTSTTTTLVDARAGRAAAIGTALALTWLNPHVYLDTVVLLGSVGSSHGGTRWAFAAGAVVGSTLWFTALGLAARALAPVFARPSAWRVLDGTIAVMMSGLAAGLVLGAP